MNELTLERRLAADAQTLFAYVTSEEHLLKWWGPEGIELIEHQLDFSRPGPWSSVMQNRERQRFKVTGEVLAVDPPRFVELSWAWHDGETGERGHESRVRFEIIPEGEGRCLFRLTQSDFADEDSRQSHEEGWNSSLDRLARLFA